MELFSKTFQYRLSPNKTQEKAFEQWAGHCRFVYNLALEQRIWAWEKQKKSLNYFKQNKELTLLKREANFLKDAPSQCLQETLRDLDNNFQRFFKSDFGFPRFKKKGKSDSFRFPQPQPSDAEIVCGKGFVRLPKLGRVRFIASRETAYEGRLRNVTVKKRGSHWYLSLNCEIAVEALENKGSPIGIDRGIARSIQLSDGRNYQLPTSLKKLEQRRRHFQRRLSKKNKFSQNWRKQKQHISRLSERIANIRRDFLHKTSTSITKNHSMIVVEKLMVKNMSRSAKGTMEVPGKNVAQKRGLNRSIMEQGWSLFLGMCKYKASWYGSSVVEVDPRNTSKTCSSCKEVVEGSRESQSRFLCKACGVELNADLNASINILTLGLRGCASGEVAA